MNPVKIKIPRPITLFIESKRAILILWRTQKISFSNIYFSNGSHLILESNQNLINTYIIKFQQLNIEWEIDEKLGVAKNSNGLLINGELTLQSKLTPILVEKLIKSNSCELTDLHTSAKLHTPLIESLLSHWNISMNKKDNILPIT